MRQLKRHTKVAALKNCKHFFPLLQGLHCHDISSENANFPYVSVYMTTMLRVTENFLNWLPRRNFWKWSISMETFLKHYWSNCMPVSSTHVQGEIFSSDLLLLSLRLTMTTTQFHCLSIQIRISFISPIMVVHRRNLPWYTFHAV